MRKYDSNGTELWTRQFGSSLNDQGYGVSATDGGVYVAGTSYSTLVPNLSDGFVRKYDRNGGELWTRQIDSSSYDWAVAVSATTEGVYVTGSTYGAFPGQTNAGSSDTFVRKYDGSGVELWTRQFGSSSIDPAQGVSATPGTVYVVGYTNGTLPGQVSAGLYDAFVRKYDSNGTEVWTRQFGTSSRDGAFAVFATVGQGIYVAGVAEETLPGQTSSDAFVRKYDGDGTEIWTYQFGSSVEAVYGIRATSGGVYIAGTTFGTLPGQTTLGPPDAFLGIFSPR